MSSDAHPVASIILRSRRWSHSWSPITLSKCWVAVPTSNMLKKLRP